MATINSKKLLPPSKKSKQVFLVPVSSIVPSTSAIKRLKPVEEPKKSDVDFTIVKGKIIRLTDLFKNKLLLAKQSNDRKRKETEREKAEEKEKKLEAKDLEKKEKGNQLIGRIPGQSIVDRIFRFAGFTLLGFLLNNYANLLPKLLGFGKYLKPAAAGLDYFAKGLVDNTIAFIDNGYKAYDTIRGFAKSIGGENFEKLFDDFSSNLNEFLNAALLIGLAGFSGGLLPKKFLGPGGASSAGGAAAIKRLLKGRTPAQILSEGPKLTPTKKVVSAASTIKPLSRVGAELSGVRTIVGVGGRGAGEPIKSTKVGKKTTEGILKTLYGEQPTIQKTQPKPSAPSPATKGFFGKAKTFVKGAAVPVISGLTDFIISYFILKEKPGRAAASAVGTAIGSLLGTAATAALGLTTGGIGAALAGSAIIGGSSLVGSMFGTFLYDVVSNMKNPLKFAQGGQIPKSGRKAPSRQIRRVVAKPRRVQPQRTQPGRDVGGIKKIETLYGKDKPGQKSGLRALKATSSYLKGVSVLNGSLGNIMGASVDLAMGQKFDKKTIRAMGDQFGFAIQNMVDNQVSMSLGDISRQLAMANGGIVPSRRIGEGLSVGSRVSMLISNALSSMMENVSGKILQNIMKEIEGKVMPGGVRSPFGDVPPADISEDQRKSADDLIKYFTKLYGRNAAIGIVANLLRESGLRTYAPEGGFHGMAQWDDTRWSRLTAWAQSKGKDPMSRSVQAEFIALELNESGTGNRLKKATTPEDAASIFYNEFERAAYSRPILGSAYTPDNPHEQKNRGFIAALVGGVAAPSAMVSGGVKPSDIPLTSGTGWRWGRMHKGVDLDGGDGSPISSAQDAKVIWAGDKGDGYGNSVVLRYSNGAETRFAHLKSFNVSAGQSIKAGQLIGRQGNTGSSTASHLHFEYYPSGGAMTYEGYSLYASSVMNSYFRYGGNVVPKLTNKPADIFNIEKKKQVDKNKPSDIFNWNNQSSIAPSQQSKEVASLQMSPSYALIENNTILYQKEIVLAG